VIGARAEVPQLLLRASEYLRARHPDSPLAYRTQRLARWGELESAPAARERRTELRGPAPDEIAALRQLEERASWRALLAASEDAFWQTPLWLDLQRWSHTALRALGGDHEAAALGIEEDVRGLLQRIPGLARLSFQDGTPFADTATERWLEEVLRTTGAAPAARPAARPSATDDDTPDPLDAALAQAREQARGGDAAGAIRALELTAAAQPDARARFRARLELAAFCAELGRDRIALALLDALDAELTARGLDAWEPELAARVLETAWHCERRQGADAARSRADALFERLCRLAPSLASELA
jgi:type VI secretion system protein VasJ